MAMGWYLKAAYEGSADAQRKVDAFRFETTNRNTVAPAASLNAILGNQLDPMDVASSVEKADDIAEMATVCLKAIPKSWTGNRKAADQGYAAARRNIGDLYENGRGVTQDYSQAMEWYKKAADQGCQLAKSWFYNL
ncbi:hypothetical protein BGX33_010748 [Mortierella sp. NVP41]|nr:hypothetical protein BGX33_010748 [Mortierella sp. NVP41]